MDSVKIFVGTDRSQWVGVKVLEHSLRRFSSLPVEVVPLMDLPIRPPRDPAQDQRTGFSFSRFCIPKLMGYRGRAIYMDADMLVFKDIRELWQTEMEGAAVLVQEALTTDQAATHRKKNAPTKRTKQSSVMLLDCEKLGWEINEIVSGLDDKKYDYAGLMSELVIVPESAVGYKIPFRWNSLEHYEASTCLIHYTDMRTQPWVYAANPFGHLWIQELKLALADGTLSERELEGEVSLGYARPSLLREIHSSSATGIARRLRNWGYLVTDRLAGFRAHAVAHSDRKAHLARLRQEAGLAEFAPMN